MHMFPRNPLDQQTCCLSAEYLETGNLKKSVQQNTQAIKSTSISTPMKSNTKVRVLSPFRIFAYNAALSVNKSCMVGATLQAEELHNTRLPSLGSKDMATLTRAAYINSRQFLL